jgi:plastocyanin
MTRRASALVFVLAAFALALAACGGGNNEAATTGGGGGATTSGGGGGGGSTTSGGGGGGGSTVQISADPSGALKFEQTSVEATAGSVTIQFTNDSPLQHDVKIEGNGVNGEGTDTVTGGSTSATVDLQPGTYTFYCSVDGHRAAGMEGTLVVK